MKIGFVINAIATEKPEYTTVRLALAAARKGHDTWLIGVDDFSHRADGTVAAHARSAADNHRASEEEFLESIQDDEYGCDDISIEDLDKKPFSFMEVTLGLAETDSYWTAPAQDWTQKKAFSGNRFRKDYPVNY